MAPMPAPMPSDTAMRPSSSDRSSRRVSREPKPAEICAAGPSRPPEPPEPIVSALATVFTTMARPRIRRGSVCTASIASSVPWPSASGANRAISHADTRAPVQAISGIAQGRWNPADPGSPPSPTASGMS